MTVEVPAGPEVHVLDTSRAGGAAIRGSVWRISGYLVGTLLAVVSSAVLFRHLGLVAGSYSLATALVIIVAGLSDLGLTAIGVRELSIRPPESRERFARSLLGIRIVITTIGVAIVAIFALLVGYGATIVVGVLLAGVGLMLQTCQSTLSTGLMSDMRFGWVSAFDFLRAVLTAMLIVVLALSGAGLLPFLAISIPVGAIVYGLNIVVVRGRMPLRPAFHPGDWWAIIRGALPYSMAAAASTIYTQAAIVVVSLVTTKAALADFSLSTRAIQMLLVLPALAASTALPIFARAARDDRQRLAYALGRMFEVSLLLGAGASLAFVVGAPLTTAVYGPTFARAVPLVAIQGVGLGTTFVGTVWSNGLVSLGRYRLILLINLTALLIGTGLIVALASVDGAHGAAIATAMVEGLFAVVNGAALVTADRTLMPSFRIVPKVALAGGLAALTVLVPIPDAVRLLVALAIYAAVVLALHAVPAEIGEELRVRRTRRA